MADFRKWLTSGLAALGMTNTVDPASISAPLAQSAVLNSLEAKAKQSTDPAVQARYQEALLKKWFPEYVMPDGTPRFFIATNTAATDKQSVTTLATRLAAAEDASTTGTFNTAARRKAFDPAKTAQNLLNRLKEDHEARSASGLHDRSVEGFSAISIATEPNMVIDHGKPTDCSIKTPDTVRLSQLNRFFVAEHEVAHLHQHLSGNNNKFAGQPIDWQVHRGENYADTYAALRTIAVFGQEGTEYVQYEAQQGLLRVQTDADHFSYRSLMNVSVYDKENPGRIAGMTPPQLAKLAGELSMPLNTAELKELNETFRPKDALNPQTVDKKWEELLRPTGKSKTFSIVENVYLGTKVAKVLQASFEDGLARHNPLRPASMQGQEYNTWNPENAQQVVDLQKFNASRRMDSCPAFSKIVAEEKEKMKAPPPKAPGQN